MNNIVVQKYGGTSVGSIEKIKKIATRVKGHQELGKKVAVVVSAMSGETNRLVALVNEANPEAPSRSYDMAVAAGEQVSVALMAAALEAEGVHGIGLLAYQLGIYTDAFHSKARIESIDCAKMHEIWKDGGVPVIAGFQGVTREGELTTLGRGGSDTSAVALACALNAELCEINTDVDGVYTSDPRVVKHAKRIETMDFEVALEMASLGSKVLHNRCVELAAKHGMPLVVRSTFKEDEEIGTKIMRFNEKEKLEAPVVSGVTIDRNVVRLSVESLPEKSQLISSIFGSIAECGVNVDVIVHNQSPASKLGAVKGAMTVGFTVGEIDSGKAVKTVEKLIVDENLQGARVSTESDLAKVSVVGLGMISHPGVASKVFAALAANSIEIKMISTSEIKISCVIPRAQADEAANCLHNSFIYMD